MLHAGIVDQDVEPAVGGVDPRHRASVAAASVTSNAIGSAAWPAAVSRAAASARVAGLAAVEDDMGALLGQGLGHGEAQPARGAGHERDAPVEAEP